MALESIVLNGMSVMDAMEELSERWLEMERFKIPGKKISRSDSLGLGSGESVRAGQSSSRMGLGDALQLSREDFAGATRILRAPAACSV